MPGKKSKKAKAANKSFEDNLNLIQQILNEIESGDLPLDQTMSKWEEGVAALKECRNFLQDAKTKIEHVMEAQDGSVLNKDLNNEE